MLKGKKIFGLFGIILFVLILILITPSENFTNCYNQRYFYSSEFSGVVVKKYFDKSEHSTPTIEIKSTTTNIIKKISFFGEFSGLFQGKINIGDTILKASSDLKIFTYKGAALNLLGVADYKCDSISSIQEDKRYGFIYRIFK